MQCFTYENKYPRTVLWRAYQPPPLLQKNYTRQDVNLPERTKNGRPYCPDVDPYPQIMPDIKILRYNPPLHAEHRNKNMTRMLDDINRINWTTGQDAQLLGRRKSKLSESMKYSLQSTYRDQFRGHKLSKPPEIKPNRTFSIGITPCTYPAPCRPRAQHPYTMAVYCEDDECAMPNPNKLCGKNTVPVNLPAPYPGPLPGIPHALSTGDDTREKTRVMGLVP